MDKAKIVEAIHAELQSEFQALRQAAEATREGAVDEETKAEGKYDTRSTEASYLADGQAKQATEIAEAAEALEGVELREFGEGEVVDLGAVVTVRLPGEEVIFFVAPAAGGVEVKVDGEEITVITPEAPLGRQLMGRGVGERTEEPEAEILKIF